jgi:hypothetical protein
MALSLSREPIAIANGLSEIVRQGVAMLIIFGVLHWTGVQTAAVIAFVSLVLTFVATLFTRTNTVSIPTANSQIQYALNQDPTAGTTVADVVKHTGDLKP